MRADCLESHVITSFSNFFFTLFVWWFCFLGCLHLYCLHAALLGWGSTEPEVEPHLMEEGPGVS